MEHRRAKSAPGWRRGVAAIGGLLLMVGCGQPIETERRAASGSEVPPAEPVGSTSGDGPDVSAAPRLETADVSGPVRPVSGPESDPCGSTPVLQRYTLSTAGGRPASVAADADGSVWFTDPGAASIGRLEVTGAVTRYPLSPTSQPGAIARGSDGNFWFTDMGTSSDPVGSSSSGASSWSGSSSYDDHGTLETQIPVSALPRPSIGRITPQGVISHFFLPVAEPDASLLGVMGHQLGAITAGPDGAMWFTETGADQIGRIDADGTITEFPLPERHRMHTNPAGIVTGPDGAIWFSQPLRESLGRIDVNTHEITERYLPPPRGGIVRGNSISSGPGDALWFDDARNQGIGRLTLDGEVDTLPLPSTSDYWPESVTAGPDGSVWFLDSRGRRVMRMTPEGSVIEFPALDGFEGGMMTAGSDGALWFASPGSNTIGRITCRP